MVSRFKATWFLTMAGVLAVLLGILLFPQAVAEGARRGLRLCAEVIVPSLFPFFVLSGMLHSLGLPELLGRLLGPVLARLWRCQGTVAAPFALGILGGYPLGAAALAELRRSGELEAEEAARLLPVCNNTGPAFALGALGLGVFHSLGAGLLLYAAHLAAAVLLGLFSGRGLPIPECGRREAFMPPSPSASALPEALGSALRALGRVCGFVLLFSLLSALLERCGLLGGAVLALHRFLGLEPGFARALLLGLLELGGGVGAMAGLPRSPGTLALAAFLLGFGSLSVHCQTLAVSEGIKFKASRLLAGRLAHAALSAGIVYGFSLLLF